MPVYFIQNSAGQVKIGRSKSPHHRLRALQAATPDPLALIRSIEGGSGTETWLHKHFADLRIHGEWFAFSEKMLTVQPPSDLPSSAANKQKRTKRVSDPGLRETTEYIIDRFGGVSEMARSLGHKNVTTVQHWRESGCIPSRRWPEVFQAACHAGVDLHRIDFVRHLPEPTPTPTEQ